MLFILAPTNPRVVRRYGLEELKAIFGNEFEKEGPWDMINGPMAADGFVRLLEKRALERAKLEKKHGAPTTWTALGDAQSRESLEQIIGH